MVSSSPPRPRTSDISNPRPRLALEDLIKSALVLVLELRGRGRGNLEKPRTFICLIQWADRGAKPLLKSIYVTSGAAGSLTNQLL